MSSFLRVIVTVFHVFSFVLFPQSGDFVRGSSTKGKTGNASSRKTPGFFNIVTVAIHVFFYIRNISIRNMMLKLRKN